MPLKTTEQFTLRIYSSVFKGGLLLAIPLLLFRPKTRAGLGQKLGFIQKNLLDKFAQNKQTIWIHTVSVGEFNGAFPLIESIRAKYPNRPLVISTTTEAGQLLAKQRMGQNAQVIYFPFDLPVSVERFLSLIDPALIIIFETELWPNFISACWDKKIPVTILNARMSPRSFKRYKLAKWLFAPVLNKLALIGTQSEIESQHYKEIGGSKLPIQVFGNLKYDWMALLDDKACNNLKNKLGIGLDDLVIIAGSTHTEEEKVILNAYRRALTIFADSGKKIKLIIAPRHPERFDSVAKIIANAGFRVCRLSRDDTFIEPNDIYLIDTIGQLANFYALASVAFVGGTMIKIGGHNLLEPYLYAVPVVCGPHLFKTKEAATILNSLNALFIANDSQELEDRIIKLLQNDNLRKQMGAIGKMWLENNRGAVAKALNAIAVFLDTKAVSNDSMDKNCRIASVLTPFTLFYKALLTLHQTAYKHNWLSAKQLTVPVISVGNLSVGGTGKTPVIVDLASQLLGHNIKVGILSRGYKRINSKSCTVVGDGLGNYASPEEAGDEPLMMAKMLPRAVVIVDKDRFIAGRKAIDDYNCQILLLDDGFQHWKLKRDFDIVLLDYDNPPWDDNLLPAGRLREPLFALKRASYIVITKVPQNYDQKKIQQFKEIVASYAPHCQINLCRFEPSSIHQLIAGKWTEIAIDKLNGLEVISFCGIAKPEGFFDLVKKLGANVANQISFADHHNYSKQDIQLLEKQLKTAGAEYLITTRKDLIKLENSSIAPRLLAINLNTQWIDGPMDIITSLMKFPAFNNTKTQIHKR